MATKSKKTTGKSKVERNPQVVSILEKATEDTIRPNVQAFVAWIASQGGPDLDPVDTQIVISSYKHFQKSDAALAYREEVAGSREAQQAERDKAREEARAKREAEKAAAAAKAEKAAAKSAKSTKGKASAAKESVPATKTKTAKKAPAKKVAAAKTGKKTARKAAF